MKQISIAIVIPYFGRFNNYFRLWLESAKNNPTIDFLLFTDQEVDSFNNIKVFKSSLQDVSNLAQRNLSEILKEKGLPVDPADTTVEEAKQDILHALREMNSSLLKGGVQND